MKRDAMTGAELPKEMVIEVIKVTHLKTQGKYMIEGIDAKTGQPVKFVEPDTHR